MHTHTKGRHKTKQSITPLAPQTMAEAQKTD